MSSIKLDAIEEQRIEEIKRSGRKFRVTTFTSSHKITGTAFVAADDFDISWRSSDFLRSISNEHMVLGDVEMRDIATGTVVDRPDFVMLNLDAIEVMYAEEVK